MPGSSSSPMCPNLPNPLTSSSSSYQRVLDCERRNHLDYSTTPINPRLYTMIVRVLKGKPLMLTSLAAEDLSVVVAAVLVLDWFDALILA